MYNSTLENIPQIQYRSNVLIWNSNTLEIKQHSIANEFLNCVCELFTHVPLIATDSPVSPFVKVIVAVKLVFGFF